MLRGLTAKQLRELLAFSELEPFGERRADYRSAQIVQILYNINRGKGVEAIKLEECLLQFEGTDAAPKRQQTWQEQEAIMKMWVMGLPTKDTN